VVRVGAGDDEHVEQLVAVAGEVELPRHPPLRHPGGVHHHAGEVERPHDHLVARGEHRLRARPEHEHLVHDWNES
ncbi:Os03g0200100, partial [Oryza sativa Japonica Group]